MKMLEAVIGAVVLGVVGLVLNMASRFGASKQREEEKEKALNNAFEAKQAADRYDSNPDERERLRDKYTR